MYGLAKSVSAWSHSISTKTPFKVKHTQTLARLISLDSHANVNSAMQERMNCLDLSYCCYSEMRVISSALSVFPLQFTDITEFKLYRAKVLYSYYLISVLINYFNQCLFNKRCRPIQMKVFMVGVSHIRAL